MNFVLRNIAEHFFMP